MGIQMNALQFRDAVVRVHLCGRQGGMAEQLFYRVHVGSLIQHVGRESVPEDMRASFCLFRHHTKVSIYNPINKAFIHFIA